MKETAFSSSFIEILKVVYPYIYEVNIHGHSMQKTGVPDHLYCIKGKFVALEFKIQRHGKISTNPRQIGEINKIKDAGGVGLFIAVDEASKKILIRERRLDSDKLFLFQSKIIKRIEIDWDFEFNHFEDIIALMGVYLGG